jgi:hypothetical protein
MFVLCCCIRTVVWNVKRHEGRKDLNSTKMDQRKRKKDRKKKKRWCVIFNVMFSLL